MKAGGLGLQSREDFREVSKSSRAFVCCVTIKAIDVFSKLFARLWCMCMLCLYKYLQTLIRHCILTLIVRYLNLHWNAAWRLVWCWHHWHTHVAFGWEQPQLCLARHPGKSDHVAVCTYLCSHPVGHCWFLADIFWNDGILITRWFWKYLTVKNHAVNLKPPKTPTKTLKKKN